jgi:two-component system, NarL family, response regulator LiaR
VSPDRSGRADDTRSAGRSDAGDRTLTVSLVNDYEIILQGLHAMLEPFSDRISVVEHEVGGTPHERADIALFDTFAGRRDAIARASKMASEGVVDQIVLYTWDASEGFLEAAREAEVSAVLLKSLGGEELADALVRIGRGETVSVDEMHNGDGARARESLSIREREVLAMLALGYRNREIAHELFLSVDTVKTYVRRVFQKLGVNNRTQAALKARDFDLAPPQSRLDRLASEREATRMGSP